MSILSNFTVVDLIKTRSASIATITGKVLKFNIQTAAEMHYTPYVQVLVNPKDKQFAIRAWQVETICQAFHYTWSYTLVFLVLVIHAPVV